MYPTFFPIIEEEKVQKIFSSDFSTGSIAETLLGGKAFHP